MVRPVVISLVVLLVAAAGLSAIAAMRRAKQDRTATGAAQQQQQQQARAPFASTQPLKPLPAVAERATPAATPSRRAAPTKPKGFGVLRIRPGQSVELRSKPAGRTVATERATTQFGSPTTLAVAAQHGGWLGVTSTNLPNGKLGWVKARSGAYERHRTRLAIRIDLSKRRLTLSDGRKTLRRATVGIGRPGSPTPTGRYAITDKIPGSRYGAFYGCCILALSGHQTNTPAGWRGGDRLAIHGTDDPSSIGVPSSAGCLHAEDADLRTLMRRVPLGTPVFISS